MRAFFAVFLLLIGVAVMAQDTIPVLDTIPATPLKKPKPHFMFGLNVTRTITGLLRPGDVLANNDPYFFTFRVGNERTRWRSGLNFTNSNTETSDPFQGTRKTRNNSIDIRTGVEWNFRVGEKFDLYWGVDATYGYVRNKVNFLQGFSSTITTKTNRIGVGPVTGIMFRLHPRIMLSTECSVYAIYVREKTEIRAFPDISNTKTSGSQFSPILPASLFINFYF